MLRTDVHGHWAPSSAGDNSSIVNGSTARSSAFSRRYKNSCRVRAFVLFGGDAAAFFFSSILSAACVGIANTPGPWPITYGPLQSLGIGWHGWETLLVLAILLSHLAGRGHYTRRIPFWTELGDVLRSSSIAFLFDFVLATKVYGIAFSTGGILRWVLFVPLLILIRSLARIVLNRAGLWTLRTMIVGDADAARAGRAALSSDKSLGYDVVAEIKFDVFAPHGDGWQLPRLMEAYGADFIVVTLDGAESRKAQSVLAWLALARVPFAIMSTLGGLPVFGFDAQYFLSHDVMFLVSRNNLLRPVNRATKLIFDYVLALLLLVAFLPVFALIALLIKRDGGPVFFRQERIGSFGRPFTCLKFRSMVVNSDEILDHLIQRDPDVAAEWSTTQKLRNDPRVTAIGRFLRATSLDELPQLLNVLRGEMSLVGPRPIVASEVRRYGNSILLYTETKPGLTGLWQVSGRSDTSYERRVQIDGWYVKNWTLWHDIAILIKTLPAVLRRRGAM